MRFVYSITLFILMSVPSLWAQTFTVDTLLKNGSIRHRINLVFLGDGYTATEQVKFVADVNEIVNELFNQIPFKHYKNYFNVFAVKVISEESGANHSRTSTDNDPLCANQPVKSVNNYFGSMFDYGKIHRLLYPAKISKVVDVLSANFPLYDQAFVIVNTSYYGGAGGFVATASDNPNGREVAIHEIGHSFAGLADEYWAGENFAAEFPNMTKESSPALVKWKNWIDTDGVNIYPHSGNSVWKKPHTNCKMERLNVPLCRVCSETFVERFHALVPALEEFSPKKSVIKIAETANEDIEFALALVEPDPSTLKITWENNDVEFAVNEDTVRLSPSELTLPAVIRATVIDTTSLSRSESHKTTHAYIVTWNVKTDDGIITGIEAEQAQYEIQVFANPVVSQLNLRFKLSEPTPVQVSMMDETGKTVRSLIEKSLQHSGEHRYSFSKEDLKLNPSAYVLRFQFGKTTITRKIIVH